jgi:hypothetical protein
VPISSVFPLEFIGTRLPDPAAEITGTLADGTPLDLDIFAAQLPANVILAAPGEPGCGP